MDELPPHLLVTAHQRNDALVLYGVLAHQVQNMAKLAVVFIVQNALEVIDQRQAHIFQHIGCAVANIGIEFLPQVVKKMLKKRLEQRFLVLEMPVQRAARYCCLIIL